jgi:hypothetical protein
MIEIISQEIDSLISQLNENHEKRIQRLRLFKFVLQYHEMLIHRTKRELMLILLEERQLNNAIANLKVQ